MGLDSKNLNVVAIIIKKFLIIRSELKLLNTLIIKRYLECFQGVRMVLDPASIAPLYLSMPADNGAVQLEVSYLAVLIYNASPNLGLPYNHSVENNRLTNI